MGSITTHLLSNLLLCSFRYALGRRTYITSDCAAWLTQWWHILPRQWQEQIHDDIRQAIERNAAGHACDIEQWKRVLALPIKDAAA